MSYVLYEIDSLGFSHEIKRFDNEIDAVKAFNEFDSENPDNLYRLMYERIIFQNF